MKNILMIFLGLLFLPAAVSTAQVKIIFDADFGDDGDDLAALLMLHHLQDLGECEIIAIGQSNNTPGAPAAIDIINTYYNRPNIPIGQQQSNTHKGDQYATYLRENYPELTDLSADYSPDCIDVYRKALAESPDSTVKIIVEGLKKGVADLLKSGPDNYSPLSGMDLVAKKVIAVYDMGGIFPSGKEFNYELEPSSTKYFVENWPTHMFFAGSCWGGLSVGRTLRNMDTPPGHAMDEKLKGNGGIYWNGKSVESHQNCFDCAPVMAAVRGETANFNTVSGCNSISSNGSNSFKSGGNCDHVYASCSDPKIELNTMEAVIESMITAEPAAVTEIQEYTARTPSVNNYSITVVSSPFNPSISMNFKTRKKDLDDSGCF